jgi:hypothetical protein
MDVGVRVDPGDADSVEIAWEDLPSIEARVAAGDPALVDPIGAEQKVAQARRLPPSDRAERLKDALAAAAAAPAPPGKLRAVAMVATIRGRSLADASGVVPPGVTPPGVFNADAVAQQRAASIKAALARTQDPAARKAMIDQFHAMGYEIDADDVTG